MKCIILAAGYATRLYPLTENFPKPLLEVGKKTIVDWLVDDIASVTDERKYPDDVSRPKIDQFIVVTNARFDQHFSDWALRKNEQFENEFVERINATRHAGKLDTDESQPITVTVINDRSTSNETRLGAVKDIQIALQIAECHDDVLVIAGDNVLDFSFSEFVRYAEKKGTSCVMCLEENDLAKQQRTAIISFDETGLITSYEEKPKHPKGNHAVPPFYFYKAADAARIGEALNDGCNPDAPGSFAAWLSKNAPMYAWKMPGKRYDIGTLESYQHVQDVYKGITIKT